MVSGSECSRSVDYGDVFEVAKVGRCNMNHSLASGRECFVVDVEFCLPGFCNGSPDRVWECAVATDSNEVVDGLCRATCFSRSLVCNELQASWVNDGDGLVGRRSNGDLFAICVA